MASLVDSLVDACMYDLKKSGHLLKVFVKKSHFVKSVSPHFIFIVDRSGSMLMYSAMMINRVIPLVLSKLGYPSDMKVSIITFDSIVEQISVKGRDPTITELANVSANSRGCTNMSGVIRVLMTIISKIDPSVPIIISHISDGDISDIDITAKAASIAAESITSRPGTISVCLYRLMSSSSANPDTRGLACIGCFDNSGKQVSIETLDTNSNNRKLTETTTLDSIVEQMIKDLANSSANTVSISTSQPIFRRMPNSPLVSILVIPCDREFFCLVEPGTDLTQITCDDTPIVFKKVPLNTESDIAPFLEYIFGMLRMGMVQGNMDIKPTLDWFRSLQTLFDDVSDEFSMTSISVSVRDRINNLKKIIHKRKGSIICRILALANVDRVDKLNSAQAYDFLRNDVKTTGTAKRAAKMDEELDFDTICRNSIKKISKNLIKSKSNEISFYSQESMSDIMSSINDILPIIDDMTAGDILSVFGGLGLAVRFKQCDYPDPWSTVVYDVYLGLSLNESDLITAFNQGNGKDFLFPGAGPNAIINGVVPLRSCDEESYDIYTRVTHEISALHCSKSIRGILARIPWDCLARDSAVLYHLISKYGPTNTVPEVARVAINSLINQISRVFATNGRESFSELSTLLAQDDPRPFLIGIYGVSGILKPLTIIIASPECTTIRDDPIILAQKLRYLYGLDAYNIARRVFRDGGRFETLNELLGINLEESRRNSHVGNPFEPDGEYNGNIPIDFVNVSKRVNTLKWMPTPDDLAAFARKDFQPISISNAFNCDIELFQLGVAVQALNCPSEDALINKGLLLDDEKSIHDYIENIVFGIYKDDYAKRLAQKRSEEAAIAMTKLLESLISTDDIDQFIKLLNTEEDKKSARIPNHSSPGFKELLSMLIDFSHDVPQRLMKLWIVLLGRNHLGEPVWNNGNVYNGDYTYFAFAFEKVEPSKEAWTALKRMKEKYGIYKYRDHKLSNRHGHGNDKPSFWAFGHKSLDEFQKCVSPEVYTKYVENHANCCGFAKK